MGRMCRNVKKVAFVKIMVRPGSVNSGNSMVCRNLNVISPWWINIWYHIHQLFWKTTSTLPQGTQVKQKLVTFWNFASQSSHSWSLGGGLGFQCLLIMSVMMMAVMVPWLILETRPHGALLMMMLMGMVAAMVVVVIRGEQIIWYLNNIRILF